ncbi:MAG: phosphatidate cytidylyltransferase [Muribaculaceae bacterium]|nr:phosphatidate cytidylyltransferase [Muribaculaceae bacterium]
MKNLITRAISGIVYIALIIGAIYLGTSWTAVLMAIFGALAMYEYHRMAVLDQGYTPVRLLSFALAEIAAFLIILSPVSGLFGMLLMAAGISVCVMLRFVLTLYDSKSPSALGDLGHWVLSVLYVSLPLACAVWLDYERILLPVFVMIWLNDTGAYCTGSLLGRHRLFERLSPKKSWEGFWGGMLFCVGGGIATAYWGNTGVHNVWIWVGAGILTCIFSTWGDLFESLIKRTYHMKDSGNIIPGHGGILDRIDSLLFVAPVILLYFILLAF